MRTTTFSVLFLAVTFSTISPATCNNNMVPPVTESNCTGIQNACCPHGGMKATCYGGQYTNTFVLQSNSNIAQPTWTYSVWCENVAGALPAGGYVPMPGVNLPPPGMPPTGSPNPVGNRYHVCKQKSDCGGYVCPPMHHIDCEGGFSATMTCDCYL